MKILVIKGCYTLIAELNSPIFIPIGKRGIQSFKAGYYAYVGSALHGLEHRIGRHLRKEKRLHWHIDYLLQYAEICGVICAETGSKQECRIAEGLQKILESVPGFGCSDCRCFSHLFFSNDPAALKQAVLTGFKSAGLTPDEYDY